MVKINFVLFERQSPSIVNPLDFKINLHENNLVNIVSFWLKNTDTIVLTEDINISSNTSLYLLQRHVYNYLNIPYHKILDIEILFVENKDSNIILNRYPNRGEFFDFQSTITEHSNSYNILISDLVLYVFVLLSTENNNINSFVERYLITEAKNAERSDAIIQNSIDSNIFDESPLFFRTDRKTFSSYGFTLEEKQPILQSTNTEIVHLYEFINNEDEDSSIEFDEKEDVKILVPTDKLYQVITSLFYTQINEHKLLIKDQESCSICKCDYDETDNVSFINKCNHLFHHNCIKTWLTSYNNTCPVCRVSSDIKIYKK
jgi:hypothetical protein